jgi:parallel beta-helix repeat protein
MNRTSYAEPEPKLGAVLGKRALVYLGILVFALALLLIFNTGNASAAGPTYVYEDITSDTTWIEADSPYIVNDSIAISPDVTLTIEPNVTVMFDNGVELVIGGTLNAVGTSDEPISFTSNGSTTWGAWGGMIFNETSADSILDNANITYQEGVGIIDCEVDVSNTSIMYAGSVGLAIMQSENYTATFTNLTIFGIDGPGFAAISMNGFLDITLVDCLIDWTYDAGIIVEALLDVDLELIDCQVTWNTDRAVYIYSDGGDANLLIDGLDTWVNDGIEIDANNTMIVASDLLMDGIDGYGIWAYGPGSIDVWIEQSAFTYTWSAIVLDSWVSDITIILDDVEIDETDWKAVWAAAEGALSFTATDVAINDTYGIYLWAIGAVDISIDPSQITNTWNNAIEVYSTESTITVDIQDLLIDYALGYGIYANANNSMAFTATNLEVNATSFSGIYLISNEDDGMVDAEGLSVSNAGWYGLFLWANTSADVSIIDFLFDTTGDDAVRIYANNTNIAFVAMFGFIYDADGDAFSLEAPNGLVDPIIGDIFADGIDIYFLYVESPLITELWMEFDGIIVNDTAYVIPAVVMPGDIDLILIDSSFTNIGNDCFWMLSTDGNITVDMTNSVISVVDGDGIFAWAPNGWVSVMIDPSVIDGCEYGIFVDAVWIPTFDLIETTISNCDYGVLLYADTEDLVINIVDCIFNGNYWWAFSADANLGNLTFDMIGTLVNDTSETGIDLESSFGDVSFFAEDSEIVVCHNGVFLNSPGDIVFDMIGTMVIGSAENGVMMSAAGNITIDMLDVTIDDSGDLGLAASTLFGDVTLSMMGGMVNDSGDAGIYLWSVEGYIFADFYQVDFGFNGQYSILLETGLYDIDLLVDECVFTGDYESSIWVEAGNDSYLELTGNVMNGYESYEAGWYFFDEIEYEYEIVDPNASYSGASFIYNFPTDFWFQGSYYSTAYVYRNGYISLGGTQSFPVELDSVSLPVIVPCQENFNTGGMYPYYGYRQYDDRVVFQWDVFVNGDSNYLRNVFEVVLYNNGDIQFNYAEMESVSHSIYDYGLGFDDGYIDVGQMWLTVDPFDNDWTSYYFAAMPMSYGAAVVVESYNNNTAWVYDNTISNYFYGGVNCYADEGWVWMDVVNNSFSYMMSIGDTAPLMGYADDNTIWANVQDNAFMYSMMGAGFISYPSLGGVDEVVVVNNTFQDVGFMAIGVVSFIEDYSGNATLTYSATRTITDNIGVNSGLIIVMADVYSENSSLDIAVTDLIARNVFTGYPKIYDFGMVMGSPLQPEGPEGSINCYFGVETEAKESTAVHTVDIIENTHVPINMGFMAGFSGIVVYDDVEAYDSVIAFTSDIEIAGNHLVGEVISFSDGVYVVVDGYVYDDADLTMDVLVDINDNFIENVGEEGGYGVYVESFLKEEDGTPAEGSGTLNATVLVWQNTIINFEYGVYEDVEVSMWNFWGDFEATVDTLITQNWIEAYDCVYIEIYAQCGFSSYFPSYEEEIWSSVTADYLTTITENDLFADDYAIDMYYDSYVQEDGSGTFANAMVDFDNDVIIADNLIESSNHGIECYGYAYAYYGEAELWSDTVVEIYGNTLVGVEYEGPMASGVGIEVYEYAQAYSSWDEFDDAPVVYDTFVANILDNTVENFDNGIEVCADIYTQYGLSFVDAMISIDIANNDVTFEEVGIETDVYCDDSQWSQYGFSSNATADVFADVVISSNTIICVDEDFVDNWGIFCDASSDTNITDKMWFWIQDNTINGEFGSTDGISVSEDGANANWMISRNAVDMAYDCIHVVGGWAEIVSNTLTNSYDDGISVTLANGYITANTIGDCGYGVYIYNAFDIVVSDNDITTTWEMDTWDGMLVSNCENLTIENNMIDGFEYGIDLYGIDDSFVTGNTVLNSLYEAVYVYDCENLEFSDNLVQTGFSHGIYVEDSSFIVLADNVISDFMDDGIYLYESDDCVIADNEIFAIGDDGLDIEDCYDTVLYNGIFYDCYYAIDGESYSMIWIIDGVAEVRNCPVYFKGDVIVVDGGWLNLDFVSSFELYDDYYDGVPALTVEEGGLLTATNTVFGEIEGTAWLFDVYGTMEMDNSWVYEAYQLYCGPTSDVTIHASSIWYSYLNGVFIDDCSPVLAFVDISFNEKAGVYITGENADPVIKDCIISFNERGIYANEASIGQIVDNLIFYNDMTGIYVDSVVGEIHDNILIFNQREIFVMNSVLSIEDNQIGYSSLVEVMADYWSIIMGESGESSMAEWSFDPEDIMSLMTNHIGVYVENSVVECSGNVYGMLSYALYAVESDVLFMDSVEMYDLVMTYFDEASTMYNITLPIFVYDGIFASESALVVADAYIEVLDDAIFLEATNATVDSCVLVAGDFDIYAMDGSNVDVIGGELDKVKAEDDTEIGLWYTMTVYTVDPDGNPVDVWVMVFDSVHTYPIVEGNSSDGVFTAQVMAGMWTSSGEDTSMNPYTAYASFEGGNADQTVTVDGDVEMTLQDPGPESPHLGAGFAIAVAVIAGILVVIGLLTLAVRP